MVGGSSPPWPTIEEDMGKYKKAGWDSVGYCTEDFMKASGLLAWNYRETLEKRSHGLDDKNLSFLKEEVLKRKKAEKFYREEARKLVNAP